MFFFLDAIASQTLIRIEGGYLAYSYDHSQIYGENITFPFLSYNVSSQYLKIDLPSRSFYAFGGVILKNEEETIEADELLFDPVKKNAQLIKYGEQIEIRKLGESAQPGSEAGLPIPSINESLRGLSLYKIQNSLIYSTVKAIEITTDFEVYGYNVTLFVEGLESIGFSKLKLSLGDRIKKSGLALNKIWFTKTQGLLGQLSYFYEGDNGTQSYTQINYEEHSILKNYSGLSRQIDLQTTNSFQIGKDSSLGLAGNYNSASLWNTRIWLDTKWSEKKNSLLLDFSYNKPIHLRGEAWIGLQSAINSERLGNVQFSGRYEFQNQALVNFSFQRTLFNRLGFLLKSSYAHIKTGAGRNASKIFAGDVNISYNAKVFNLSTDYTLNYDLFGNQLLSRPQLRAGLNPFSFYSGILTATVFNIIVYNDLRGDDFRTSSFSNNSVFNLATKPIFIQKSLRLNLNFALEQFLEKEGRNFTSGGFIVNANKTLAHGISIEGFYSLQSRRKTKGWLIEGTTSQDLSALLKLNPSDRINGWLSVSYDPKRGEWRQSFADVSLGLVKNWKFQSLLNYDFLRHKINNIDLYLIREAGRLDLRFVWRSISRQFLVELIPR